MLELIVLGQVPGTAWQLDFATTCYIALGSLLIYKFCTMIYRYRQLAVRLPQLTYHVLLTERESA